MLGKHARAFFAVEIRNEREGGVSPATIDSALDSLRQAPTDVVASWIGLKRILGKAAAAAVQRLSAELAAVKTLYGGEMRLQELLDIVDQQPIGFTCPFCGGRELEEVRTDVIVLSRVVGRLPRERLFIYGRTEYGYHKSAPFYQCGSCKRRIAGDEDQMHQILDRQIREAR